MKLVDAAARNAKEFEAIQRKVKAFVKTHKGCSTGDVRFSQNGAEYYIEVDNDGKLGDYISDIISASPNAKLKSVEEYKGVYMWSADVYVRPCTVVTITF